MLLFALAAEAAADDHGAGSGFPPFETWHYSSQVFWLAVLFGGMYIILSAVILPRMQHTLERRGDTIASSLDEAGRLDERAKVAKQELEQRLAQARAKARETADQAQLQVSSRIAEETARVDAEIDKQLADAEARIAEMRTTAMANVSEVATEAAAAITARLGGPKGVDVRKAVDAALSDGV